MTSDTLLLKNADLLCTMAMDAKQCPPAKIAGQIHDHCGAEIKNGGLFARNGVIEAVGKTQDLAELTADRVIDMTGHVVIPGMVNTHHHMFQNLTRAVPAAQNAPLFGWLQTLYPIWCNLGPDHIYWSNALGMAELALTVAPHHRIISTFIPTGPGLMIHLRRPTILACGFMAPADQ